MRITVASLIILAWSVSVFSQPTAPAVSVRNGTSDPPTCQAQALNIFLNRGVLKGLKYCDNGVWVTAGVGTVRSVGNGTIGSLFVASWATPTTTPALSFDFAALPGNTVISNATAGAAVPTAFVMPSCSASGSALKWTAGTGFGCGTTFATSANNLSFFGTTSSAQLASVVADSLGDGVFVRNIFPTFTGLIANQRVNTENAVESSRATDTAPTGNFAVFKSAAGSVLFQIDITGAFSKYAGSSPTNGQLLVGDTGAGNLQLATITPGANIAITNTAHSITVSLTGVVPAANGGTGTGSTLSGIVRGGNPLTASELSGDATTSGSNVVTLKNTGTAGTFGDATHTLTMTTDAQGRVTAVTANAFSAGASCSTCTANVMQEGNGTNALKDGGLTESPAGTFATAAGTVLAFSATAPAAASASQAGKGVTITPSNAVDGTSTHAAVAGGDITLNTGAAVNSGRVGEVVIPSTAGFAFGGTTSSDVALRKATSQTFGTSSLTALAAVQADLNGALSNITAADFSASTAYHFRTGADISLCTFGLAEIASANSGCSTVQPMRASTYKLSGGDVGLSKVATKIASIGDGTDGATNGWLVTTGTTFVASDLTSTSSTMGNITGLTATLIAGRSYSIELTVKTINSIATDGIKFDVGGGSATATTFWIGAGILASGGTDVIGTNISTSLTGAVDFTTFTGESVVTVKGYIKCNAAGTLIPRFAEDTSTTGTMTVRAGTMMIVRDLG